MLVTRLTNVRYLTGFTGSNAQTIVTPSAGLFFTDGRYTEQSRHEVSDMERVTYLDGFDRPLADACVALGIGRLGFEPHDVTVSELRKLQDKAARRRVRGDRRGRRAPPMGEGRGGDRAARRGAVVHRRGVRGDPGNARGRDDRAPGRVGAGARAPSRRRRRAVVRIDRGVRGTVRGAASSPDPPGAGGGRRDQDGLRGALRRLPRRHDPHHRVRLPAGGAAEDPRCGAPGAAGGDRRRPRGHDRRARSTRSLAA